MANYSLNLPINPITMKSSLLTAIIFVLAFRGYVQETNNEYKIIDTNDLNGLLTLDLSNQPNISQDGKFISYQVNSNHYDYSKRVKFINIRSIAKNWIKSFQVVGGAKGMFTKGGQNYVFSSHDSLFILRVGSDSLRVIPNITYIKYSEDTNAAWVCFRQQNKSNSITLSNFRPFEDVTFENVVDFYFVNKGESLLLKISDSTNGTLKSTLSIYDIRSKTIQKVCNDHSYFTDIVFNKDGSKVAIMGSNLPAFKKEIVQSLFVYDLRSKRLDALYVHDDYGNDSALTIASGSLTFSGDAKYLLFRNESKQVKRTKIANAASVDIWAHKDLRFQTSQIRYPISKSFQYSISLSSKRISRITYDNERVDQLGRYALVQKDNIQDKYWLRSRPGAIENFLVSLENGERLRLPDGDNTKYNFFLAENLDWLVYYDLINESYFSIDILSKKTHKISGNLNWETLAERPINHKDSRSIRFPWGVQGWSSNGKFVFVYSKNDIWKFDLTGIEAPDNWTNNFGQKNNILLRFAAFEGVKELLIPENPELLLVGFNHGNKYNGLFSYAPKLMKEPKQLLYGPYSFYLGAYKMLPQNSRIFSVGMIPIKAPNSDVWLFCRQSFNEQPNLYITKNWKHFERMTHFEDIKKFRWLSAELLSFPQNDDSTGYGILYKPVDFDSSKKYPVLINYYMKSSQRLYNFIPPSYFHAEFNIPWMVSREYLVFTPDLDLNKENSGFFGPLNSVEGAVKYLCKLGFVDSSRIAISGHSMAGAYTNYILSHSNFPFAAALSGAGVSDPLSASLWIDPLSGKTTFTYPSPGSEDTLWNAQRMFNNSTTFNVDKIKTPILLFHSKIDMAVPWEQSLGLFTLLWRFEKPVWMLQYDVGNHLVFGKDALDFTIRLTQFFDHYLMYKRAPKWMTEGIPIFNKQFELGFDLDSVSFCSNSCKVCLSFKK
jgi:dienelactone hydrolase